MNLRKNHENKFILFSNKKNSTKKFILHDAVNKSNKKLIQKLLVSKHKPDINQINEQNNTPLDVAAYVGDLEVIKILIAHGAEVNSSCLSTAILMNNLNLVRTFLKCLDKQDYIKHPNIRTRH